MRPLLPPGGALPRSDHAASVSILAVLGREGVRATFFFTGAELAANPGLGARFVRAGHELGNHSYSHRRMVLRSPSFVRREIEATDSLRAVTEIIRGPKQRGYRFATVSEILRA